MSTRCVSPHSAMMYPSFTISPAGPSRTEKGPDLSWAPEDVRNRFSKTVEEFMFEPTGTMKIILESQIVLSDEEKWEVINKITKAYDIVKNREND